MHRLGRRCKVIKSSFKDLFLIPASVVLSNSDAAPDEEGVYYVFFNGGLRLLKAISYFDCWSQPPLSHEGSVRLYTGSSLRMRTRAMCHLRGGSEQSGLRKTLAAVQLAKRAISRTRTEHCTVKDKQTLDAWMLANTQFAFVGCSDAARHEKQLLKWIISPLNIQYQSKREFADRLLDWRRMYYPRDGTF